MSALRAFPPLPHAQGGFQIGFELKCIAPSLILSSGHALRNWKHRHVPALPGLAASTPDEPFNPVIRRCSHQHLARQHLSRSCAITRRRAPIVCFRSPRYFLYTTPGRLDCRGILAIHHRNRHRSPSCRTSASSCSSGLSTDPGDGNVEAGPK